jgi:2-keto-4-pentenoate hydratase/2-oxohepta-3-ene-1,7-dioic acid hydratase in catechol pathway
VTLKFGVIGGRSHAILGDITSPVAVDIAQHTDLPADPMACFARWEDLRQAVTTLDPTLGRAVTLHDLDCPVPQPRQMFAVGLNYRKHAEEMNSQIPSQPLVFAKFQSSLNSPTGAIHITGGTCDYESEVIIVIAQGGRNIDRTRAWGHIAGLCVGQDISDRGLQYAGNPPQFSMGKSRQGFSPIGPWVADMSDNQRRDSLRVQCSINGELRQNTEINDMIFPIDQIVSHLSSICELYPGDVIYTGSPWGVGHGMKPPLYLKAGDVIETTLEGVGSMINRCI